MAFKKVLGPKRVIVRTILAVEENPKYNKYTKRLRAYRKKVEEEIIGDCSHFLDMLHAYCVDRTGNGLETETFFITLVADMTRYICEQTPPG